MRLVLAMFAAVVCLVLVVYLRDSSKTGIVLSVSVRQNGSKFARAESTDQGGLQLGEVPPAAQKLATTLKQFYSSTVQSYEASLQFDSNRPLSVGQMGAFGSVAPRLQSTPRGHWPLPWNGFPSQIGQLEDHIFELKERASEYPQVWLWATQMHGLTNRGFIYCTKGRKVVAMPSGQSSRTFLRNALLSGTSVEIDSNERVWNVVSVALIPLLTTDRPMVFDNYQSIYEPRRTRELDQFEVKSLSELQAGADRVTNWDDEHDCLQVVGALRASEKCVTCHETKSGQLLAAMSYRFAEVAGTRRQPSSTAP